MIILINLLLFKKISILVKKEFKLINDKSKKFNVKIKINSLNKIFRILILKNYSLTI